ncbi:MAG: hypothetical protein OEO21_09825, partial [Candidatus Krumholzibacteria bacterium]|nr:hypothetical protein [Candidatus Krumholzibacteria bacterium]
MPKTASPRCLVAHSSEASIQLRFRVSDPILRPVSDAGVTYHRLDLEKTRPYGVPGLPEVPVITTYIAVPACDSVTLEAQIAASHVVNGVNVYPQPAYVLQNPG